jgi:uncharacterized protein
MIWVYFFLLIVTDLCGLLLAAFTLPGLWLMLGAAAFYAYLSRGEYLGYRTLIVLLVMAGVAEIAEIFVAGAGAKQAGASRWGILGGFVGAILGGILLSGVIPVIAPLSTLIGICLGTFLGAFGIEFAMGRPTSQSVRIGYGAAKGRLLGMFGKVSVGIVMVVITLCAGLPIHFR